MNLFDASGDFVRDTDRDFFKSFMSAFAAWIDANAAPKRAQLAAA